MVARGYKDTEIGVIPEDWEVVSLGDILEYEQPTKYLVDTTDYDDSYSTPVLTAGKTFILGYTNETNGIFDNLPAIIFDDFTTASKYVDFSFKAKSSAMKILKVKNKKYPTKLFYEYLNNVEFFASTHKRYWISEYQNLKIPLPPLKEQEKIADILSTADEKIDAIEGQIQKAETLKKALLQKLLSEGIGLSSFKDSELGKIPESWEIVTVEDITDTHKQGYYTKDEYTGEGTYLIRITDLGNPKIDYSDMPILPISDTDYKSFKVNKGDFLFARSGAIGRYGIVYEDKKAVFASYLIRFTFQKDKIINEYFGYFYETKKAINQLLSITQGSSNININANNIKSIKIPLPPLVEQKQIAEILSTADEKLEVLRAKKQKYETLKKGLLQKLLSGEVRV